VHSNTQFFSEVVTLVASILPVVAVFQVFDGTNAVSGGILRARGKQVSVLLFYCTV
jgi:MATE family multidrug resistance protein